MIKIPWDRMKWRINNHSAPFQYEELSESTYFIWIEHMGVSLYTNIDSDNSEEFETNYKDNGNKKPLMVESETGLWRVRNRDVEGTLKLLECNFTTGVDSLDQGTSTYYSINVTSTGITEVKFSPDFSYYVRGGFLECNDILTDEEIKGSFIFAPSVPHELGGHWEFVENILFNSEFKTFDRIFPSKFVKYIATMPVASECLLKMEHEYGVEKRFKFWLELYS